MTSAGDEMTSTDDEPGVVVLGTELAAARAAQERHVPPGPSPLGGVAYERAAHLLWRWVDSAADATVAAFVHRFVAAAPDEQAVLRARLTMDDFYALMCFARRRAFAAIRTGDGALLTDTFDTTIHSRH
jgi:hypothetical protein